MRLDNPKEFKILPSHQLGILNLKTPEIVPVKWLSSFVSQLGKGSGASSKISC